MAGAAHDQIARRLLNFSVFAGRAGLVHVPWQVLEEAFSWKGIDAEAHRLARKIGYIADGARDGHCFMPIALLVSMMPEAVVEKFEWLTGDVDGTAANLRERSLAALFASHGERNRELLLLRLGLLEGRKWTLAELADRYSISRERVRQIERRFMRRLWNPINKAAMLALLCSCVLENRGSLVFKAKDAAFIAARTLELPTLELIDGRVVIGLSEAYLGLVYKAPAELTVIPGKLAKLLEEAGVAMASDDLRTLAESLSAEARRGLRSLNDRLVIVMRMMGRPAHYSEIAQFHDRVFPERQISPRSVHNALLKHPDIVPTGALGEYALREWGFTERPSRRRKRACMQAA